MPIVFCLCVRACVFVNVCAFYRVHVECWCGFIVVCACMVFFVLCVCLLCFDFGVLHWQEALGSIAVDC